MNVLRPVLGALALAALQAAPAYAAPLGQWPLNEGSGQVAADVSGRGIEGRLGALPGPDAQDPAWVAGRLGSGLRFDDQLDQYVAIRDPSAFQPARVSVEAWVRRLGTPGQWRYVVSSGATGCRSAPYGLYSGFGGGLGFYVSDSDGYVLAPEAAPAAVWDGAWHHAAGTYDGRHVRLFVDGAEVGAGTGAELDIAYGPAATGVYIGSYRGSCVRPFTGDIDEVTIHDSALSSAALQWSAGRIEAKPLPPQAPPVSGPPAPGGTTKRCLSIAVTPKRVVSGRRSSLLVKLKRRGRPAAGMRVSVRGPQVKRTVRTGRKGMARLTVRPRRRGSLRVAPKGQPANCTARVVKIAKRR